MDAGGCSSRHARPPRRSGGPHRGHTPLFSRHFELPARQTQLPLRQIGCPPRQAALYRRPPHRSSLPTDRAGRSHRLAWRSAHRESSSGEPSRGPDDPLLLVRSAVPRYTSMCPAHRRLCAAVRRHVLPVRAHRLRFRRRVPLVRSPCRGCHIGVPALHLACPRRPIAWPTCPIAMPRRQLTRPFGSGERVALVTSPVARASSSRASVSC